MAIECGNAAGRKAEPMQSPRLLRVKALVKESMPAVAAGYWAARESPLWLKRNPRRHLNKFIKTKTRGIVQHGPFVGMRLIDESSWGVDGNIAPKLLGVYEKELHDIFIKVAQRRYGAIVDVGSAEGFYAVGLARMFPGVPVYAYDADPVALALTKRAAEANGVSAQVTLRGFCDPAALGNLAHADGPLLVLSDCEGYEMTLFDSEDTRSALRTSDLVIECHDLLVPKCTEKLVEIMEGTHRVTVIRAGGRDPNAFDFLAELSDSDRWQAVNEYRAYRMNWLWCDGLSAEFSALDTRTVGLRIEKTRDHHIADHCRGDGTPRVELQSGW